MIQLYSLAVFLTGMYAKPRPLSEQKTRPGNHHELAAKQLSLPPQVVFEAILSGKKWAVPVSAMVLPFRMANGRRYSACRWRFRSARNAYSFDAIDNQPVDLLFALLVPADQLKRTCILCRWWRNVWRTKPLPPFTRSPER